MAASAENTMFKKIENEEIKNNEIKNNENNEKVTNEEIHDSDDDMIVISIRETNQPQEEKVQEEKVQEEKVQEEKVQEAEEQEAEEQEAEEQEAEEQEAKAEVKEQEAKAKSKQQEEEEEQKGEELFFKVRDDMDKKKLFPIMPCNMVSAFVCAMEHVEYLDIKDMERKALVIELVKCLAYINNEYGAKECFDYLFQNNMTDDIIKTIIDCTKDRYDINKYPHTNRNIVLSCVSLSKKVKKTTKPKLDMLDELFDFKFSFCDLKRFFRIKDSSKSV